MASGSNLKTTSLATTDPARAKILGKRIGLKQSLLQSVSEGKERERKRKRDLVIEKGIFHDFIVIFREGKFAYQFNLFPSELLASLMKEELEMRQNKSKQSS